MITDYLKFGAIGVALAAMLYASNLVRQEIGQPAPRPGSFKYILAFMIFSIIAIALASFIELYGRGLQNQREESRMTAEVNSITESLKANVGGKFQASVSEVQDDNQRKNLIYFTNAICKDAERLWSVMHNTPDPQPCVQH